MGRAFTKIAFTPNVKAAQEAAGSRRAYEAMERSPDGRSTLTSNETDFIAQRDGFYLATVAQNDWPYVQYRGGAPGFLRVLDERTLSFTELRGNQQFLTQGNLAGNDRVMLFLMDYAEQRRLKIWGRARYRGPRGGDGQSTPSQGAEIVIAVEAFDWNCHQHITPRYTVEEFRRMHEAL